jgi:hypothetical protein
LVSLLAGAVAMLLAAVLLLHATAGVRNYLHWTIQFAAERRLPGLQLMLSVYSEPLLLWWIPCIVAAFVLLRGGFAKAWWAHLTELTLFSTPILWMLASLFLSTDAGDRADILHALWPLTLILSAAYLLLRSRFAKTPWARPMALILLSAPFLWTLAGLFLATDAEDRAGSLLALWPLLLLLSAALTLWNLYRRPSLRAGLPILLLAAIHGTFLSQQLWGSTYAIWPLLMLLIAEMIVFLASIEKARAAQDAARTLFLSPALVAMISATLLICGGFYIVSEERLSYAELPTGPVVHSTLPALRGLAVPGPYLPAFEELLRFASEEIPVSDGLILIPGEDPFYFATGRVPQFPVLLFDKATDPYSPAQLVAEARLRNIRWLIVKREMQMKEDPTPQRAASLEALQQLFQPYRRLGSYDVYRRP